MRGLDCILETDESTQMTRSGADERPMETPASVELALAGNERETAQAQARLTAVRTTLGAVMEEIAAGAKAFDRWGPSAWMAGVGTVMIAIGIGFQFFAVYDGTVDQRLPSRELFLIVIIGALLLAAACVYRFSVANRRAHWANARAERLEQEERDERSALRDAEQRAFELRRQALDAIGARADEAHRDSQGHTDGGRYD